MANNHCILLVYLTFRDRSSDTCMCGGWTIGCFCHFILLLDLVESLSYISIHRFIPTSPFAFRCPTIIIHDHTPGHCLDPFKPFQKLLGLPFHFSSLSIHSAHMCFEYMYMS